MTRNGKPRTSKQTRANTRVRRNRQKVANTRNARRRQLPARRPLNAGPSIPVNQVKRTNLGNMMVEGGGMLGGFLGSSYLGRLGGKFMSRITGQGAYKVQQNSLGPSMGFGVNTQGPVPTFMGERGTVFAHAEYLGDVFSGPSLTGNATAFDSKIYRINPGDTNTFPWLSQVAQSFEKYELLGCVFEFRSMTGDAISSTNAALGSVILSTQYNINNPNFTNKVSQENFQYASSGKPSCNILHPVECAPADTTEPKKYVRTPQGTPNLLTDWGNFQISTQGVQATNVNLGELWVTYHVRFWDSKLNPSIAGLLNAQAASWVADDSTSNFSNAAPMTQTLTPIGANSQFIKAGYDTGLGATIIDFDQSQIGKTFLLMYTASINSASASRQVTFQPSFTQEPGSTVTIKAFWKSRSVAPPAATDQNFTTLAVNPATLGNYCFAQMVTLYGVASGQSTFRIRLNGGTGLRPQSAQLVVMEVPLTYSSTFTARKMDYLLPVMSSDTPLGYLLDYFCEPLPSESVSYDSIIDTPKEKFERYVQDNYSGDYGAVAASLVKTLQSASPNADIVSLKTKVRRALVEEDYEWLSQIIHG